MTQRANPGSHPSPQATQSSGSEAADLEHTAGQPAHPVATEGIYIVVPAYNEAGAVGDVVRELREHYRWVVVIDDGSRDLSSQVAADAGAIVLRHPINRGQGAALQTGITFALEQGAEIVITFDSDGQHRVEDLPRLLHPILQGDADVVLGSRFLSGADTQAVPWTRRLLLRGAVLFTRMVSGPRLTDAHNGFRAFSRRAAQRIQIRLDRMAHASELVDQIHRSRLPYQEVPVRIRYTEYSRGKGQRASAAFRVAWDYLLGRVLR
ncbi:MAG: glycosyltransferase family 2 protein [Acidobacteriota bacterium]